MGDILVINVQNRKKYTSRVSLVCDNRLLPNYNMVHSGTHSRKNADSVETGLVLFEQNCFQIEDMVMYFPAKINSFHITETEKKETMSMFQLYHDTFLPLDRRR